MQILFYICILGIVGLVVYLSVYIHALLDRRGYYSHWWFFGDVSAAFTSLLTGSELDGERRYGRLVLKPESAEAGWHE